MLGAGGLPCHMKKLLLPGLILFAAAVDASEPYQFLNEIKVGGEGGWDIVTIDNESRCLYLSHSTKVDVVNLENNTLLNTAITDTPGVHEFLPIHEFLRGFSSNGRESKASVVDLTTLRTISKLDTGEGPDEMAYDSLRGEVYVFNHKGDSVTVIGARTASVTTTIPLGGSPEFAVADSLAHRVYCNLQDKSEVAVIDTTKHEVIARWPLAPGQEPSGIAFDLAHHRLFSTCHNKTMVMLDTESGKVVASVPIGAGTDGCAFDDAMQLAFASCGDGTTTIAKEEAPDKLTVVQTLKTERGARTMALDPKTHRIYLPTAQFQAQPPATPKLDASPARTGSPSTGASPARPTIVPNTLKLLVYGPTDGAKP